MNLQHFERDSKTQSRMSGLRRASEKQWKADRLLRSPTWLIARRQRTGTGIPGGYVTIHMKEVNSNVFCVYEKDQKESTK